MLTAGTATLVNNDPPLEVSLTSSFGGKVPKTQVWRLETLPTLLDHREQTFICSVPPALVRPAIGVQELQTVAADGSDERAIVVGRSLVRGGRTEWRAWKDSNMRTLTK